MAEWMDELKKLAELREMGLITDEEFEAEKTNLLPSQNGKATENEKGTEVENEEEESEGTNYYLELTDAGKSMIHVIKEIRAITSWGLKEAKEFAESVPWILLTECSEGEALQAKKALEMAGATVLAREIDGITISNSEIKERIKEQGDLHVKGYQNPYFAPIPKLKCPHCGEAGRCIQTHRSKFRQDTTRLGTIFGSKTWQDEMNVECQACGLTSTIKGSSHYGI